MKDPSDNIRDWLYGVLYGTVSYEGAFVSVYSFPPANQAFPYIAISEQMMSGEQGTKDAYITEHSATIEIYAEQTGNVASYVPVNTIADSVLQIIRRRKIMTYGSGGGAVPEITGYNPIRILVDSMVTDRFSMQNRQVIYKSINLKILLEEL